MARYAATTSLHSRSSRSAGGLTLRRRHWAEPICRFAGPRAFGYTGHRRPRRPMRPERRSVYSRRVRLDRRTAGEPGEAISPVDHGPSIGRRGPIMSSAGREPEGEQGCRDGGQDDPGRCLFGRHARGGFAWRRPRSAGFGGPGLTFTVPRVATTAYGITGWMALQTGTKSTKTASGT